MTSEFEDNFKKEFDDIGFKTIRRAISDKIKLHISSLMPLIKSGDILVKDTFDYRRDNYLYKSFSLDELSETTRKISDRFDVTFMTGFSPGEVLCKFSSGLSLSLVERKEKFYGFELTCKFRQRVEFYFSFFPSVSSQRPVTFFATGSFFIMVLCLKSFSLVFLGFIEGLKIEIFLSVFLCVKRNFFFMRDMEVKSPPLPKKDEPGINPVEITLQKISPLSVELGPDLIFLLDPSLDPNPFLERAGKIRKSIEEKFIFPIPGVIFKDNLKLKPAEYIIKVRNHITGRGCSYRESFLVLGYDKVSPELTGKKYSPDFLYDLNGIWIEKEFERTARVAGCLVMNGQDLIHRHLENILYVNLHKIFGLQDMEDFLDRFVNIYSKEIIGLRALLEPFQIWRVFKNLLRDHIPLIYTEFILNTMLEIAKYEKNPEKIYEYLRRITLPFIIPMCIYKDPNSTVSFMASKKLEDLIVKFSRNTRAGYELYLPFRLKEKLLKSWNSIVCKYNIRKNGILICSQKVRPLLTIALKEYFPHTGIFTSEELPSGYRLNIHDTLDI